MTLTAYKNARLLDLDAERLGQPTTVVVKGDRIDSIGQPVREGVEVIDLGGRTLMPGLIDSHFHVVAHSLDLWSNVTAPDSLAAMRAAKIMEGLLDRGFTTVRDLGGADLGLAHTCKT